MCTYATCCVLTSTDARVQANKNYREREKDIGTPLFTERVAFILPD